MTENWPTYTLLGQRKSVQLSLFENILFTGYYVISKHLCVSKTSTKILLAGSGISSPTSSPGSLKKSFLLFLKYTIKNTILLFNVKIQNKIKDHFNPVFGIFHRFELFLNVMHETFCRTAD